MTTFNQINELADAVRGMYSPPVEATTAAALIAIAEHLDRLTRNGRESGITVEVPMPGWMVVTATAYDGTPPHSHWKAEPCLGWGVVPNQVDEPEFGYIVATGADHPTVVRLDYTRPAEGVLHVRELWHPDFVYGDGSTDTLKEVGERCAMFARDLVAKATP